MLDCEGNGFAPGDQVAVAARQSSSAWLQVKSVASLIDGIPHLVCSDGRIRKYMGTSRAILNVTALKETTNGKR